MLSKIDRAMIDEGLINQIDETTEISGINPESFPIITPEVNDTGRLQRAIDSAGIGLVVLPPKTYTITSPLKLTSGVRIVGVSKRSSIIQNDGTGNSFETLDWNERYYDIFLDNFTIRGNVNSGHAVYLPNVSNSGLTRMNINTHKLDGIFISAKLEDGTIRGAYYNTIRDCQITGCRNGVNIENVANDNRVITTRVINCEYGLRLNGNNNHIFGNSFEQNTQAQILLDTLSGTNKIIDNRIEAATRGIDHRGKSNVLLSNYFEGMSVANQVVDTGQGLYREDRFSYRRSVDTHNTGEAVWERTGSADGIAFMTLIDRYNQTGSPMGYRYQSRRSANAFRFELIGDDGSVTSQHFDVKAVSATMTEIMMGQIKLTVRTNVVPEGNTVGNKGDLFIRADTGAMYRFLGTNGSKNGWKRIGHSMDNQADSTATTVDALKADFNALLAKLKAAQLME